MVADLDRPYDELPHVPGAKVERVEDDGHRVVFALDGVPAGGLIGRLTQLGGPRDVAVQEPDIEDVVARLYAQGP